MKRVALKGFDLLKIEEQSLPPHHGAARPKGRGHRVCLFIPFFRRWHGTSTHTDRKIRGGHDKIHGSSGIGQRKGGKYTKRRRVRCLANRPACSMTVAGFGHDAEHQCCHGTCLKHEVNVQDCKEFMVKVRHGTHVWRGGECKKEKKNSRKAPL